MHPIDEGYWWYLLVKTFYHIHLWWPEKCLYFYNTSLDNFLKIIFFLAKSEQYLSTSVALTHTKSSNNMGLQWLDYMFLGSFTSIKIAPCLSPLHKYEESNQTSNRLAWVSLSDVSQCRKKGPDELRSTFYRLAQVSLFRQSSALGWMLTSVCNLGHSDTVNMKLCLPC